MCKWILSFCGWKSMLCFMITRFCWNFSLTYTLNLSVIYNYLSSFCLIVYYWDISKWYYYIAFDYTIYKKKSSVRTCLYLWFDFLWFTNSCLRNFPQGANVTLGISFLNVLIKWYKMTAVQECRVYEAIYLV